METNIDQLLILSGLTSFITNGPSLLYTEMFSPPESSALVLASLLTSGAELESLVLSQKSWESSPALTKSAISSTLGSSIAHSAVRSLIVSKAYDIFASNPELFRTLVASLCPRFEHLQITGIELSPDEARTLGDALAQNCAGLSDLKIRKCMMKPDRCAGLAAGIRKLRSLSAITLYGNNMHEDAAVLLIEALTAMDGLREIRVRAQGLEPRTLVALRSLLQTAVGEKLQLLDLCSNGLENDGISALADVRLPLLRQLFVSRNRIGPLGAQKLAQTISGSPSLVSLRLSSNLIGKGAEALGKAIGDTCKGTLEELNVANCELALPEVVALFTPLRDSALRELTVTICEIEKEAAAAVADCLSRGRIRKLIMFSNSMKEIDAAQIAKVLEKASELQILDLSSNPFKKGGKTVLNSINTRYPMETLRIEGCGIGNLGAIATAKFIRRVGCRKVDLLMNEIDVEGIIAIVDAVEAASVRTEVLDLGCNPVGAKGAKHIAERLVKPNRSVVELGIADIKMKNEGAKAIAGAIRDRREGGVLKKLILAKNEREDVETIKDIIEVQEWEKTAHGWSVIEFSQFA